MTVAVLFARADSCYKQLPACDVYDEARDARTWAGGSPVVAHPPCRGWGRLRHMAKIAPHELDLARFAVAAIRRDCGVLEHPASSQLWADMDLPRPGGSIQQTDQHGGWSLCVDQSWWGHACPKRTWLYIVGCRRSDVPAFPLRLGKPAGRIELATKADRERTPAAFALWLRDLAARCIRG